MKGWRTLILAVAYLLWVAAMAVILRPPDGYTPEGISSLAMLAVSVGTVLVGFAGARVAKSYALAKHAALEDPA